MRTCSAVLLASCVAVSPMKPAERLITSAVVSLPLEPDAGLAPPDAAVLAESMALDASIADDGDGDGDHGGSEESGEEIAGEEPAEAFAQHPSDAGWLYTAELSDEALFERWKESPDVLGSISMGFVEEGRLINAVPFPEGEGWTVVSPETAYGTQETIDFVTAALRQVKDWRPDAPPLHVNHVSAKEGGYLRPHKTHQNGRDVDLGFFYPGGQTIRVRERERVMDVALNWALVKALVMHGDVQFILVDQRVQKVLFEHAKKAGEDPAWLDSLFHAGRSSILQHARRHRDHFHVRYFNARAQELGRRVAPLLAERPEENLALHRVRSGDTLGGIALKYGSSAAAIRKASGLSNNLLRIGRVLKVPLRKPCTSCPVPPPTIVPPRRLPPEVLSTFAPDARVPGGAAVGAPGSSR